ncbi:MAG: hypothetical protein WCA38_07605 [Candidatus Acidiferrales bacterium]
MIDFTYDIFALTPQSDPLWVEAVCGLEEATRGLKTLAESKPEAYSIFDSRLARFVDTHAGRNVSSRRQELVPGGVNRDAPITSQVWQMR